MLMANFFRDVLLPASAAIGLLVTLAIGPARARVEPGAATVLASIETSESAKARTCRRADYAGVMTSWPCR